MMTRGFLYLSVFLFYWRFQDTGAFTFDTRVNRPENIKLQTIRRNYEATDVIASGNNDNGGGRMKFVSKTANPFLILNQENSKNVDEKNLRPYIDEFKKSLFSYKMNDKLIRKESVRISSANENINLKTLNKSLKFKKTKTKPMNEINKITGVKYTQNANGEPCKVNKTTKEADCSNRNLKTVPQELPVYITSLVLTGNKLNSISLENGPFKRYGRLTSLLLNNNNITSLPDTAFVGLPKLGFLNLRNNSIVMDKALNHSKAFVPLENSLVKLVLNNNTEDTNKPGQDYPDKALSYLTSLQALDIDGLPEKKFGFHFQEMTKLVHLGLIGYKTGKCNLSLLQNETFKYVPNIRVLIIADCKIRDNPNGSNALEPLTKLEYFDVSYNFDLGLDGFGKLMYGQRNNQNLRNISLKYIVQRYEPCIIIYKHMLEYFKNLSLESIDATHNNIEMIEYGAIEYLPNTLKVLNLTRNNIMFGAYWWHLKDMVNLEYLYLDGFDEAYRLPLKIPTKHIHCPQHSEESRKPYYTDNDVQRNGSDVGHLTLQLPPQLKTIKMGGYSMSYKIDAIEFNTRNKLISADLHRNYLPELNGPITGLNHLKSLGISTCFVYKISSRFFSSFESLKEVNVYDNYLGDSLSEQPAVFASNSLEELNLGLNAIYRLNKDVFKGCPNLTTLILSENTLTRLDSVLDDLPKLKQLFLTQNGISTIPKSLRDHFDRLNGHGFIDMAFNPISCDCDNIDFLEWVTKTKIFGNNYTNYYCNYPGELRSSGKHMINGYDDELKSLINQCADNTKLFICVISATVAFFLILIGVVIYRFRWTMRYWFLVGQVMLSHKSNNDKSKEFEYDLFVCYCHQDNAFIAEELEPRLSQERDIKLLLHDKCFQAGQEIAESILKAVQRSRKTLVVMSNSMLESNWCNYELAMAKQESNSTGRSVLVILFLETIPKASMSLDMVNYIRSNVIVTYPQANPALQEEFWDRLAHDLRV